MKLFDSYRHICNCSKCGANLHYSYGQNVYNGGPWYCGGCGHNVTIDMYGKGVKGYMVVASNGNLIFYRYLNEARMISEMFQAKLIYAYDHSPV